MGIPRTKSGSSVSQALVGAMGLKAVAAAKAASAAAKQAAAQARLNVLEFGNFFPPKCWYCGALCQTAGNCNGSKYKLGGPTGRASAGKTRVNTWLYKSCMLALCYEEANLEKYVYGVPVSSVPPSV